MKNLLVTLTITDQITSEMVQRRSNVYIKIILKKISKYFENNSMKASLT